MDPGAARAAGSPFTARFPALARRLPWVPLARLPSAVERAPALGAAIGLPGLLLKRDDVSGGAYGGNKVRKLEFLLGDAMARGCDAVLTYGAAGSNHALATAIYAHQLGLGCYAVLTDQVPTPYVDGTLRYLALLGARMLPTPGFFEAQALAAEIQRAHPTGPARVCEITWGGSSWLGTAGFVAAGLELAGQVAAGLSGPPDRIYLPCGTMGSVAGLAMGLRIAGLPTTVVGVKVVPREKMTRAAVGEFLAAANRELHGRDETFPLLEEPDRNIELRSEFLGEGYAIPTAACREAVTLARDLEGLKVDTTYSGKALACLVADARSGLLAGRTAAFWLTYNSRAYPAEVAGIAPGKIPAAFRKFLDR